MCVWNREGERERKRERDWERERERNWEKESYFVWLFWTEGVPLHEAFKCCFVICKKGSDGGLSALCVCVCVGPRKLKGVCVWMQIMKTYSTSKGHRCPTVNQLYLIKTCACVYASVCERERETVCVCVSVHLTLLYAVSSFVFNLILFIIS